MAKVQAVTLSPDGQVAVEYLEALQADDPHLHELTLITLDAAYQGGNRDVAPLRASLEHVNTKLVDFLDHPYDEARQCSLLDARLKACTRKTLEYLVFSEDLPRRDLAPLADQMLATAREIDWGILHLSHTTRKSILFSAGLLVNITPAATESHERAEQVRGIVRQRLEPTFTLRGIGRAIWGGLRPF